MFTYVNDKSISFVGAHYAETPIYILRRLIYQARDILNGLYDEVILNDDSTMHAMALLDDDTIISLDKSVVDNYLSTYARQYGIQVEETYYKNTSIEQKRIQLSKSTAEYKSVYLKTEPLITLNENTTDQMIQYASLNMTKTMFENYIKTFNVDISSLPIDTMSHKDLVFECIKVRDTVRIDKSLPPLPSAHPHKGPDAFKLSVEKSEWKCV